MDFVSHQGGEESQEATLLYLERAVSEGRQVLSDKSFETLLKKGTSAAVPVAALVRSKSMPNKEDAPEPIHLILQRTLSSPPRREDGSPAVTVSFQSSKKNHSEEGAVSLDGEQKAELCCSVCYEALDAPSEKACCHEDCDDQFCSICQLQYFEGIIRLVFTWIHIYMDSVVLESTTGPPGTTAPR